MAEDEPDLIILDVRLPDLKGLEICKRLKANPKTAGIPVVFLSSQHPPADGKTKAFFLGADEFLTYPIQPDQLTIMVNAVLAKRNKKIVRAHPKALAAKQNSELVCSLPDGRR
jgi:sigma-B regulation protein RsbU (phosphoserine phosphatase)